MPSVRDAIRLYSIPQQWSTALSSLQREFRYVYIQQGFFDICFEVPAKQGRRKIVISIELGRDFPTTAPVLRCKYERHMYIDGSTFAISKAAHPGLEFWQPVNDLAGIIHDIHEKVFNVTPPIPMSPAWDSTYGSPFVTPLDQIKDNAILNHMIDSSDAVLAPPSSLMSVSPVPQEAQVVPAVGRLTPSDFRDMLGQKTLNELQLLGEDLHGYLSTCNRLDPLRTMENDRISMHERLGSLETQHKTEEARLEELENLNEVLLARKREFDSKLSSLRSQQAHLDGLLSKQSIADALLASAQREEMYSEDLATAFSKGALDSSSGKPLVDLDSFLQNFLATRSQYRLRIDKRAVLLSTPSPAQQ